MKLTRVLLSMQTHGQEDGTAHQRDGITNERNEIPTPHRPLIHDEEARLSDDRALSARRLLHCNGEFRNGSITVESVPCQPPQSFYRLSLKCRPAPGGRADCTVRN